MAGYKRGSWKWIQSKLITNAFTGEFAMIFGGALLSSVFGASIFYDTPMWKIYLFGGVSIFLIILGYFTRKKKG
ncbi:hypothetical protein J4218_06220 [Candidatus Pacearchaeota archaeon]|nr:hypothetical protein [Candidatus Pacearchaeota archaeon]